MSQRARAWADSVGVERRPSSSSGCRSTIATSWPPPPDRQGQANSLSLAVARMLEDPHPEVSPVPKGDVPKLFQEEVPPELQKLLTQLLQKFQPEWQEDASKDQASAQRPERPQPAAECQLNQNGETSEQPAVECPPNHNGEASEQPAKECQLNHNGETTEQLAAECQSKLNGEASEQPTEECTSSHNGEASKQPAAECQSNHNGKTSEQPAAECQLNPNGETTEQLAAECQSNHNGVTSEKPAPATANVLQNGNAPSKNCTESREKEVKKFPLAKDSLDKMLRDIYSMDQVTNDGTNNGHEKTTGST